MGFLQILTWTILLETIYLESLNINLTTKKVKITLSVLKQLTISDKRNLFKGQNL